MSAASTASCAVTRSRISPIRTVSGSERRIAGSTAANVRPALWLTWTWLTPVSRYSTGSSTVMMLTSGLLIAVSVAYSVVDLPEPVGPVTSNMPCGLRNEALEALEVLRAEPELLQVEVDAAGVEHTQHDLLAPHRRQRREPQVDAARCRSWAVIRPFCGTRRSVMSTLAMILRRLIRADWTALGTVSISCSTPSMRKRTRRSFSLGSRCRSEARFSMAWSIKPVDVADDRRFLVDGGQRVRRDVVDGQRRGDVVQVVLGPGELVDRLVAARRGRPRPGAPAGRWPLGRRRGASTSPGSATATTISSSVMAMPSTRCRRARATGIRRRGREVDRVRRQVDAS